MNPNPQVGCVIVASDGETIGEGYHAKFGGPHAEREALADCARRGHSPKGATVYVTLEPCSHTGKTPPCADALVEAEVARVVTGSSDPNPLVAGRGLARLADAGIEVITGVLQEECDALNAPFFHYIRTGTPLVIAKYAMTLDGMTATRSGKSKWITGDAARKCVHEERARYAAVMVGVGTVLADDPLLNVRLNDDAGAGKSCWHQPARIVMDTHLHTPLDSRLARTAREQPTYIVTSVDDASAHTPYVEAGCKMLVVPSMQGRISLPDALERLGDEGLDSVILEGGATLMRAMFDARLVNRVQAYIAPKIFAHVEDPADAIQIEGLSIKDIGKDILIQGNTSSA